MDKEKTVRYHSGSIPTPKAAESKEEKLKVLKLSSMEVKESSEVKLKTLRIGFVGAAAGARRTCVPDF